MAPFEEYLIDNISVRGVAIEHPCSLYLPGLSRISTNRDWILALSDSNDFLNFSIYAPMPATEPKRAQNSM
jgi:hypothetical protein